MILKKTLFLSFLILTFYGISVFGHSICHSKNSLSVPYEYGFIQVPYSYDSDDNKKLKIYWEKFPSKSKKKKGSVFFLAGGPLSHSLFHLKKSPHILYDSFNDYDFYMYDYRGFNCSSSPQTEEQLIDLTKTISFANYAADFKILKDRLVGNEKVILFGGSFGFMLGTEIISKNPEIISKAILFSGDTSSAWLFDSMKQVDNLLVKTLPKRFPHFSEVLDLFLKQIEDKKIILFKGTPKQLVLDKTHFESYLWLEFSQSIVNQENLLTYLEKAVAGDYSGLENSHEIFLEAQKPIGFNSPPFFVSEILNVFRCNIFSNAEERRAYSANPQKWSKISTLGVSAVLYSLCKKHDDLPLSSPWSLSFPQTPNNVPILSWVGDRDMFEPLAVNKNLKIISKNVQFYEMSDWSHDYGIDPGKGTKQLKKLITEFLDK